MDSTDARAAAQNAIKKRAGEKPVKGPKTAGGRRVAGNAGELKMFTEDAPGLQIGPSTVLLTALIYIGVVVVLHIIGKIRG